MCPAFFGYVDILYLLAFSTLVRNVNHLAVNTCQLVYICASLKSHSVQPVLMSGAQHKEQATPKKRGISDTCLDKDSSCGDGTQRATELSRESMAAVEAVRKREDQLIALKLQQRRLNLRRCGRDGVHLGGVLLWY